MGSNILINNEVDLISIVDTALGRLQSCMRIYACAPVTNQACEILRRDSEFRILINVFCRRRKRYA